MTHQPEIWRVIKNHLTKGHWSSLEETYEIIEKNLPLDKEDYEPQSPSSEIQNGKEMFAIFFNTEKRLAI